MTFPTSCGSAVNKELVLLQLNPAKTEWRAEVAASCPGAANASATQFLVILEAASGQVTKVERR
jgi:hypothetical protein